MRYRIILVVLVVLVVPAFLVVAADAGKMLQATDTPQPTATLTPAGGDFYEEATRPPLQTDGSCPPWEPHGYGTVTPSGMWEVVCGHCVQDLVPYQTVTPGPSPTVTVTGTPPTATASPTPSSICATPSAGYFAHPVEGPGGGDANGYIQHPDNNSWDKLNIEVVAIDNVVALKFEVLRTSGSGTLKPMSCSADGGNCLGNGTLWTNTSLNLQSGTHCIYSPGNEAACSAFGIASRHEHSNFNPGVAGTVRTATWQYGWSGVNLEEVWIDELRWISTDEYCEETPWPTATPSPTAEPTATPGARYCDSVEDGAGVPADFLISGIVTGDGECVDIGPWEFDFLGLISLGEIPWLLHLCFVPYSLGSLALFGVTIALDSLLGVFVGVMAVRLLS